MAMPENTHSRGMAHCIACLHLNNNGFHQKNVWLLVCSEAVESILVKLETSCTVTLIPTVSVLWPRKHFEKFKAC